MPLPQRSSLGQPFGTDDHDPVHAEPVKLLLVDDREEDLRALQLVLASPGYEIVTARSGNEVLKLLLREDFAVILLDVLLPVMDGFEIAALIKERPRSRHTPLLFMTAAGADMSFIYRAYSVGAVDYLTKPIDPDVVRAKVAIFAEMRRKDLHIVRQAEALREADRRQKEQELEALRRASQARYRNLADAIPAIVFTARPEGGVDSVNRRWLEYTGQPVPETLGWGWLEAVHPEDRPSFEASWRDALQKGHPFSGECRLRRDGDGVYRWHLCHAVPERDHETIIAWLGTLFDCEDLRQAISAREEFLAVASHELRTPLATLGMVVHGFSVLLDQGRVTAGAEKLRSRVEMANRQVARLDRLLAALLDVSRLVGGRTIIHRETCDLAPVVREAVERVREQAHSAGSAISLEVPIQLAGLWDPMRIDQVITNLVTNAIRYGAGRPIVVTVETSNTDGVVEPDVLRLHVKDHGVGIAEEHLPRLFGRFERLNSDAHHGGLGLGLFITRQIVAAHGGEIRVASLPGAGSTFTVELPILHAAPASSAAGSGGGA
jgi:PAS domain S-box-containing protein